MAFVEFVVHGTRGKMSDEGEFEQTRSVQNTVVSVDNEERDKINAKKA